MNPCLRLETGHLEIDRAFRIALGDYFGNIQPWRGEAGGDAAPCILAGLDYVEPWTRDAAFNAWYAGSVITPEVARNTLLSVLIHDANGMRIGGQYWDAIIWVMAAWNHYACTGDDGFLATAFEVTRNSIRYFEETERDPGDHLFRGGACFQDGIAGYPDAFADGPTCGILEWVKTHPREKAPVGHGLPVKALSTNALYFNAYGLAANMARALGLPIDPAWERSAEQLRLAINKRFWNPAVGHYDYLVDAADTSSRQEGFGHAFTLLFGLADKAQIRSVIEHQHVTPHGIACVWPGYERYMDAEGRQFGRHSGVVWPQVNAAWVMALTAVGRRDLAWNELELLAEKACRDNQFAEIYHPVTGVPYGGRQESWDGSGRIIDWPPCQRQTWCATGFIRMILTGLLGMESGPEGLSFSPWLPEGMRVLSLEGIAYRSSTVSIRVERGDGPPSILVNGHPRGAAVAPPDRASPCQIEVRL